MGPEPHIDLKDFVGHLANAIKRKHPVQRIPYKGVYTLLLRWEADDLGTYLEIDKLNDLLRNAYGFQTQSEKIPSKNPALFLENLLFAFKKEHNDRENLLIVYYGGHGVKMQGNDSIWAATRKPDSPILNWSRLQSIIDGDTCEAEVLLLLDCCYATTAANFIRSSSVQNLETVVSQGSKEVLAACSIEDKTTGVSDLSFTSNLIEELDLAKKNGIAVWNLYRRMVARRKKNLMLYTPRHVSLSDSVSPSILLCPMTATQSLYASDSSSSHYNQTISSNIAAKDTKITDDEIEEERILLHIRLKQNTAPPSVDRWVWWLMNRIPEEIKSITPFYKRRDPDDSTFSDLSEPKDPVEGFDPSSLGNPHFPNPYRHEEVKEAYQNQILADLVRTEAAFESGSTLLLVSIPLSLFTFLQPNPGYSKIGTIKSPNLMLKPQLTRTNSVEQALRGNIAEFFHKYSWYKYYVLFIVACFVLKPQPWMASFAYLISPLKSTKEGREAAELIVTAVALIIVILAPPASVLSFKDMPSSKIPLLRNMNLTQGFWMEDAQYRKNAG